MKVISKIIVIVVVFVLKMTAQKVEAQNCSQFREGKFTYKEVPNGSYSIRKGNTQITYYPAENVTTEFKIKWKDSCTFIMTFKKVSDPEKMKTYKKGDVIYVKIIETDGNCYKFEAVFKGRKYPTTYMCKEEEAK